MPNSDIFSHLPGNALAAALKLLPCPRSEQGVSHPYHGMLARVLIGLFAEMPSIGEMSREPIRAALLRAESRSLTARLVDQI